VKITDINNFCRIFELPLDYPEGFCFGGGRPVQFSMVDWFNPIPDEDISGGKIKGWDEYVPMLIDFLKDKMYVREGFKYLFVSNFDKAFIFTKNG